MLAFPTTVVTSPGEAPFASQAACTRGDPLFSEPVMVIATPACAIQSPTTAPAVPVGCCVTKLPQLMPPVDSSTPRFRNTLFREGLNTSAPGSDAMTYTLLE